jgi:L-lactate dehydrogenase complex protein LldE
MTDKPRVALFVTCLVDQALPDIGISAVKVLRRAGFTVTFPAAQTCCGQPFFNSGLRDEARKLARNSIATLADADLVVLPSGSCTSMIRNEYEHFFEDDPLWQRAAQMLAAKTYELGEFLTLFGQELTLDDTAVPQAVTYHDSCHMCRLLDLRQEPRRLLAAAGCEINEMEEADRCCGFGGVFSVRMPEVSNAMTAEKLRQARATGVEVLVTSDPGCLMQMRGLLAEDDPLRVEHTATILEQASR